MKTIYRILLAPIILLVSIVFMGLFTQCDFGTDVELVEITDDAFLDALIQIGLDTDGDGEISVPEAEATTWININGEYLHGQPDYVGDITDLTGIEAFINLDTLICSYNRITSLDVSGFTRLIKLDCMVNEIGSLDVSRNVLLEDLRCSRNPLTALDVSANTKLTNLRCYDNQLSSLNVSSQNLLTYLDCSDNQLTALDVSNNTALRTLACNDNQLTGLDVTQLPALTYMYCSGNLLGSLDVSVQINLLELYCDGNQLSNLIVSYNKFLTYLDLSDMPSLFEVCVWATPFPPNPVLTVVTDNSPNIFFTTQCSQ